MRETTEAPLGDTEELRTWLDESDPVTIAAEIDHAAGALRSTLFELLEAERAVEVFDHLEPAVQAQMLEEMDHGDALPLFEELEPDDRARVLEALPDETATTFLEKLSPENRTSTALLLEYAPETAGRIMSPHFIALRPDMTVAEALYEVRHNGAEAETIYFLAIVDEAMTFKGAIGLEDLVMAEMSDRLEAVCEPRKDSFSVHADQEEVARYMQDADLLAVAVLEEGDRLVGIVTFDDAMDVLQREETEDMVRTGAVAPLGRPYFSVSSLQLVKSRVVWLSLLAVAATLTVNVLAAFEATLEQAVALALFIPLLIGIGGNAGAQSATTIVRALAMDDVRSSDFIRVGLRESGVGMQLGAALAIAAFFIVWLIFSQEIAVVVSLTMLAVCTLAALVGSLMPIVAKVIGVDPAVISAPLVTTIVDATGLLAYFLIAIAVLGL